MKNKKSQMFTIRIQYLETMHKCECTSCGQIFMVKVGNVTKDEADDPWRISVRCPTCGCKGRLACFSFLKRYKNKVPLSQKEYRCETELDCNCGQFGVQEQTWQLQVASTNLTSLQLAVRSAVSHWRSDWDCSVMPTQMRELERLLKECDVQTPT